MHWLCLITIGVSTGSAFAWMNPHMTLAELCAMLFGCAVWFLLGSYSADRIADKKRFSPFAPPPPNDGDGVYQEPATRWVSGFYNPTAAIHQMVKLVKEGRYVRLQKESDAMWVVREIERVPGKGFAP